MCAYYRATVEPDALMLIAARCADFHARRLRLPRAFEALLIERATSAQPGRARRGNPGAGLLQRELRRTHAAVVGLYISMGMKPEEAYEQASEFAALPGPKSAPTLKKHAMWAAAELVKLNKSE
jgi:hypothetical protein